MSTRVDRLTGLSWILAVLFGVGSSAGYAQEAEAYRISEPRLQTLAQAMQAQVTGKQLAGIATLVWQDGEVVHRQQSGYQNLEEKKPLTKETIYKIFSLTKPITGTALLMLYDEGKFQLDAPVEQYLPELQSLRVAVADGPDGQPETEAADHPVTIRELMTHTAGLTYGRFSESQVDSLYAREGIQNIDTSLADMIAKLGKLPLRQQPGSQWHYSVAVDVQARLVEVLSGMAFDEYLQERIFTPLNMIDTGFYVPQDKQGRLAVSYTPDPEKGLQPFSNQPWLSKPTFLNGGGGLVSTMDDYLRFARMLLNEGELDGVRLLKAETVRMMRSNQLPEGVAGPDWAPGNLFGLNVAVVTEPEPAGFLPEDVYWWWGFHGPWMWVDPANQIIVLGMMQNTDYRHSRVVHGTVSQILYRSAN
ncbi:serine hydrolase domain-containing protein [Halopseudomonas pelagia]|uniref:serine hydrolase domain-containing protein n=1 Tax=Halopseudomonas pelagia TaxID=553151 RepID=UPI00039AB613|nr:serine hydrolase domain-containing protein [Halopseudomonas pelagia]